MNAIWKKTLSIVAVCCLIVVTACSSSSGSEQQNESGNKKVDADKGQAKGEYVIQILTQSNSQIKRSDETDIGKIIKEKFNIVFEYVQSPGNMTDKLNLMLAGGDYPEIVTLKDNVTFDKYVQAGALLPLDDFVKNSPEFAKRYEVQFPLWRSAAYDGKLYKWEGFVPVDYRNEAETFDVAVRIDLLKQQGWPNLLSTDDYIQFLKKGLQDNPTTNGQKTIGMVVPFGEPWGMQGISDYMYEKGGRYSTAAANLGVLWNQVDKKFEDRMTNEYVKEGLAFFNKLYREGILDKDSFIDKMDQVQEKLNSGRAISLWFAMFGLPSANQSLIKSGHPEMQYINLPIRSKTQTERNEKRQIRVEDTRPFDIHVITKNAKHPERILELLAWSATEEGRMLLESGIEGKHYTIENGKRVPTDEYKRVLKDGDAFSRAGFRMFMFLGNVYTNAPDGMPYNMSKDPQLRDELTLTPEQREAYSKLGWANSQDYFMKTGVPANTGIASAISIDTSSSLGQLHQKIVDFRIKNSAKLIVEPKSDEEFEDLYNSVINEYKKLNAESIVNEYNRLYQEKQAILEKLK